MSLKKYIKSISVVLLSLVISALFLPQSIHAASSLPKYYRNKNVTSVKDQGAEGLCWAFAAVSAMETELVTNNKVSKDIDFSELALAYFIDNPTYDPMGQMTKFSYTGNEFLGGGNTKMVVSALSNGQKLVSEDTVPYSMADPNLVLDAELRDNGGYYLKSAEFVTYSNESIKKAIQKYGAVTIAFYGDLFGGADSYYNSDKYSFYCPYNNSANHAVCIIGWDDNYSKKNFNYTPEKDGAWIVKNSYGPDWGDKGYFYLSYYDKTIVDNEITAFDVEPVNKSSNYNIYSNAYELNFLGLFDDPFNRISDFGNGYYEGEKIANIFTAHANENGAEEIAAISYTTLRATNLVFEIYTDLKNNNDPLSGVKKAVVNYNAKAAGFYTINLDKPIYLTEGELFSVVVSEPNRKYNDFPVACSITSNQYIAGTGSSYYPVISYYDNNKIIEWIAYDIQNFNIRALTANCKKNTDEDKKSVITKNSYGIDNDSTVIKGFKYTYVDSDSVLISWNKEAYDGVFVYSYSDITCYYSILGGEPKGNTFLIKNLQPNTSYTFAIRAYSSNEYGTLIMSSDFATIKVKTKSGASAPKVKVAKQEAKLTWSKVSKANKYKVQYLGPDTDYEWKTVSTVKTNSYTYKKGISGLEGMFRIIALNNSKEINRSKAASVKF